MLKHIWVYRNARLVQGILKISVYSMTALPVSPFFPKDAASVDPVALVILANHPKMRLVFQVPSVSVQMDGTSLGEIVALADDQ